MRRLPAGTTLGHPPVAPPSLTKVLLLLFSFSMLAGEVHSQKLRERLADEVGEDAAWLLLSFDHYGWRSRYDLMSALASAVTGDDSHRGRHLQSFVDLEVQGALYAISEQLARLLLACRAHISDGEVTFLETFTGKAYVPELISKASQLSRTELAGIIQVPQTAELVVDSLKSLGNEDADEDLAQHIIDRATAIVDELHTNLSELLQLIRRPDLPDDAPIEKAHPLRHVDNAYRHGLRVLIHDVLPVRKTYEAVVHGDAAPLSQWAIDLYMSGEGLPGYTTVDAAPDRTAANVETLGNVSARIRQVTRGFISTVLDEPGLLATIIDMDVDEEDPGLA